MLLKVSIVLLVVAVCAVSSRSQADVEEHHQQDEEEHRAVEVTPSARLFAIQRTVTKTIFVTSTLIQTTQSVCASLTNVTGACRRRRRGVEDKPIVLSFDEEDDIDIFKPSQVEKIEPTEQADMAYYYNSRSGDVESSSTISDPVELDIIGVNSQCLNNVVAPRFGFQSAFNPLFSLFNVTLQYTTTVTASLVLTSTTTTGTKPFVVSGCTPSSFPYKLC